MHASMGFWILALLPLAAAAQVVQVVAPRFAPGDSWTYQALDGWNRRYPVGEWRSHVRDAAAAGGGTIAIAVTVTRPNGVEPREYADPSSLRSGTLKEGLAGALDPPLVLRPFPLTEGQTWTQTVSRSDPKDGTLAPRKVTVRGRVIGWETIDVPAGTFRALKIRRELDLGDQQGLRSETHRVEDEWYVPELKAPARFEVWESQRDPTLSRILQYTLVNRELYQLIGYHLPSETSRPDVAR